MKFANYQTLPAGQSSKHPVKSLTREVDRFTLLSGDVFYVKDDPEQHQAQQLTALKKLRMPLPRLGFSVKHPPKIGLIDSGSTLFSCLQGAPKELQIHYAQKAGNLLKVFHRRAANVAPSVLSAKDQETAHPVNNFAYRFIDLQSASTNAMIMAEATDMPANLWEITQYLIQLAEQYHDRVCDVIGTDDQVIYGDYKPENLIVSPNGDLIMIDPELSWGHNSFDVAKFFSRCVIDNFKSSAIKAFLTAYQPEYDLDKPLYGDNL